MPLWEASARICMPHGEWILRGQVCKARLLKWGPSAPMGQMLVKDPLAHTPHHGAMLCSPFLPLRQQAASWLARSHQSFSCTGCHLTRMAAVVVQAQNREPVRMGVVDDDSAIASLIESLDSARPTLPPNFKLSPIQVRWAATGSPGVAVCRRVALRACPLHAQDLPRDAVRPCELGSVGVVSKCGPVGGYEHVPWKPQQGIWAACSLRAMHSLITLEMRPCKAHC